MSREPVRPYSLMVPALAGFVGALCVAIGVAQGGSPFALKAPGAWFFGVPAGAPSGTGNGTFLGIMLVYAGLAVMIGSWFEIVRALRRQPNALSSSCLHCSVEMSTATSHRAT
jgi:hypothetical protein